MILDHNTAGIRFDNLLFWIFAIRNTFKNQVVNLHLNLLVDQMGVGQQLLLPVVANLGDPLRLGDQQPPEQGE